jgi:hypothetical protein
MPVIRTFGSGYKKVRIVRLTNDYREVRQYTHSSDRITIEKTVENVAFSNVQQNQQRGPIQLVHWSLHVH